MFVGTTGMALRSVTGYDMYDLAGSLAVFGFLTAYALVAVAMPFATREKGRIPRLAALFAGVTVLVVILITVLDIRSSEDPAHARIPYIYLAYLATGIAVYFSRRRQHQWLPETVAEPES
jgi:amino acid transporter